MTVRPYPFGAPDDEWEIVASDLLEGALILVLTRPVRGGYGRGQGTIHCPYDGAWDRAITNEAAALCGSMERWVEELA